MTLRMEGPTRTMRGVLARRADPSPGDRRTSRPCRFLLGIVTGGTGPHAIPRTRTFTMSRRAAATRLQVRAKVLSDRWAKVYQRHRGRWMNTTTRLGHMALVPVEHFPVGRQAYGEPFSGAAGGVAPLGQAPPPGRVVSQGEPAADGFAITVSLWADFH